MTLPSPSPPPPGPPAEVARTLHLPARLVERLADFDREVDALLERLHGKPVADRTFYTATELGDFALIWHIAGVARGLRSDRHAAEAARLSMLLGVESLLVNGVIKSFFRRKRPVWDQPRAFRIRRPRSSSFPSGHASSAFFAATVLSDDDDFAPLWFALAAVVATSRAYVRIHHASDVVAGAVTGLVLGRIARKAWPKPVDGNPFSGFSHRGAAATGR